MTAKEKAVREAAAQLATAIEQAAAAGYVVTWPQSADELRRIAISETAKAKK